MSEVRWFFSESGEVRGPYLESDLIRLARSGRISETEYILREGHQEWLSAGPLVQNAHSLPIDGEARIPHAAPVTFAAPAVAEVSADVEAGAPRAILWVLGVVAAVVLGGFAFYMLGPWSPILHQPSSGTAPADTATQGPAGQVPAADAATTPAPTAPGSAVDPSPAPREPEAPTDEVPIEEAPIGPEPDPASPDPAEPPPASP